MKPVLTIDELIESARRFCEIESRENHIELIGVTDGKAVGTYVEHKFQYFLQSQYIVDVGSSAKGTNLPGDDIVYNDLADEILNCLPEQGYLTISNALQWRLQYARVITLDNSVQGVINYEW